MVQILIPSSEQKQCKTGRYTVYCIELYLNGKCNKIERRYSEFHKLNRTLKKYFNQDRIPQLPPKRVVRNLSEKLIEYRRTSLEDYLKKVLKNIGLDVAKELNEFLNLPLPNESIGNVNSNKTIENQSKFLFNSILSKTNDDQQDNNLRKFNYHQCMIEFKNDYLFSIDYDLPSYLTNNLNHPNSIYSDSSSNKSTKSSNCDTNSCTSTSSTTDSLPDIVLIGNLDAIYDKSFRKF